MDGVDGIQGNPGVQGPRVCFKIVLPDNLFYLLHHKNFKAVLLLEKNSKKKQRHLIYYLIYIIYKQGFVSD